MAEELHLITDVRATAEFCSTYNNLFDILNCRSQFANRRAPYRQPINGTTLKEQQRRAKEGIMYTAGLKTSKGEKIIISRSKTGFLGFIIALTNVFEYFFFIQAIPGYELTYLLTYRLIQDYLENLFGAIRSKGGFNDNPTAYQFLKHINICSFILR